MDTLAMEEKNLEIVARSLLSERLANRALSVYGLKLHGRNGAGPSLFPGPPIRFPQSPLKGKLNVFQKHSPPGISARKWERARPGLSSLLFPAPPRQGPNHSLLRHAPEWGKLLLPYSHDLPGAPLARRDGGGLERLLIDGKQGVAKLPIMVKG
jgi:hypothetical protein